MDDLVFSEEEREAIITSMMETRGLRRGDAERLLGATTFPAKRNPVLERQWIRTLFAVSVALRRGEAKPIGMYASIFWIRLYGALTELLPRYEKSAGIEAGAPPSWKYYRYFELCSEVFGASVMIRDSLSDDELVYAAFLRHVHAHVYQVGFEYTVERGNPDLNLPAAVRTKQMVATIRRHVPVDDVHELVDRVVRAYGGDESAIVTDFANKVGPGVDKLEQTFRALEAERDALRTAE